MDKYEHLQGHPIITEPSYSANSDDWLSKHSNTDQNGYNVTSIKNVATSLNIK
jgi:hypothetical protein